MPQAMGAGRVRVRTMTLPDAYQDHDRPEKMCAEAGLDATTIVRTALDTLPEAAGKAGEIAAEIEASATKH